MHTEDLLNELLIEEVKKYEFIYNNAHPEHGKRVPRQQTWTTISSIVGETVQQCKRRWFGLRKRFANEYGRISDNDAEEYKSDWKYFDAMAFLKGYVDSNQNFLERLKKISKRDSFCRACLCPIKPPSEEEGSKFYNIFNSDNLDMKLIQCTNLKCVPWDEYPHSLCVNCYEKVLDFYNFQCMCRTSLEKFNVMLETQMELKDDSEGEKNSENSLQFVTEYADINSIAPEGKHSTNAAVAAEEQQNANESEPTCVDPLADQNTNDFVPLENIEINDYPKANQEFKEITTKKGARNRKTAILKKSIEKRDTRAEKIQTDISARKRKSTKNKEKHIVCNESEKEDIDLNSDEDPDFSDDDVSYSDYSEGEKEKHLNKCSLKCDDCPQTFRFQHRLEAHQRRHQGLQGYPCTFVNCERAYNRLGDLRNHLNDHNGIPNVYKCPIENCNMVYTCFSGLNKHKRKFHKCGKELKKYPCETCGKVLTNPRSLTGHRFIHLDKSQWPYVCDEKDCTRRFRLMSQLSIHKKRHAGIKNYVCPHCGVRKTTCTELKIHINFHTFEQKYPCELCSKVFKSVGMMRTHINRVHEGKKPANDITFACSFCDRKFSSLQSKKFHEMTHTGEKPYVCEECGKKFTYPSGLASHKNMHLKGDNPYVCDECGRKFKWPSALKCHMKLHSEVTKPYSCEECGKGFRWPGSYYKHKKTHMRQEEGNSEDIVDEANVEPSEEPLPVPSDPSNTKYEITYLQYTTIDMDTNKIIE